MSGTSKRLGMRPRCDPTIRTAPTCVYGRVALAWVVRQWVPKTSRLQVSEAFLGFEIQNGVRDTSWGEKCIKGKAEVDRGGGKGEEEGENKVDARNNQQQATFV